MGLFLFPHLVTLVGKGLFRSFTINFSQLKNALLLNWFPVPIEKEIGASAASTLQLKITGTYERKSRNLEPPTSTSDNQFMTNNNFIEMSDSEESEDRNSSKILTITTVEKKKENKKEERKNGNKLF